MQNRLVTHFNLKGNIIYLRVTVNGERSEISTNQKINPALWSKDAEKVTGKSENAQLVNTSLNLLQSKIVKIFNRLDSQDEKITVQSLIDELRGKGKSQMTLLQAYRYHNDNIGKLQGLTFAEATVKKYGYSYNSLKDYMNDRDILLTDLTYDFVEGYNSYLLTTKKMQQNSASKYIKNLNRVINVAISKKWLTVNPFRGFKCNFDNPVRHYLTETDIEALYSKKFTIERLEKVRDCFLFQIYTGLSFTDMEALTSDNIEIGVDGKEWIAINRHKTGVRSALPLLPRAKEILKKYNNHLPVNSNQKMNAYLKEVADLCEIRKNLTTHLGRHTFATTITLSKGVPIETVSKVLGHSSIKTTQIYAKVVDRKVSDDMRFLCVG